MQNFHLDLTIWVSIILDDVNVTCKVILCKIVPFVVSFMCSPI